VQLDVNCNKTIRFVTLYHRRARDGTTESSLCPKHSFKAISAPNGEPFNLHTLQEYVFNHSAIAFVIGSRVQSIWTGNILLT
jgi:hypothetical protein